MNGLLLIDKPENFTSFDVVAVIRKIIKQKKVGHAGTLDPMATGVLPILLGNATKAQSILPSTEKEYVATLRLGLSSDTQDVTGKILTRCEKTVDRHEFLNVLENFKGQIKQIPPMFSALKKDGKRLYALAREGIEVERDARTITIFELELLDAHLTDFKIRVKCSEGTYIRTLCHDIGEKLGCGAIMTSLRRTSACGFHISETISLQTAKQEPLLDKIISIEKIFDQYHKLTVSDLQTNRFVNGNPLSLDRLVLPVNIKDQTKISVYSRSGFFLGVGIVDQQKQSLLVLKGFDSDERIS